MQIYGTNSIHGPQSISGPQRSQPIEKPAPASSTQPTDELSISKEADLVSRAREASDVRADRVTAIRAAIESGVYETDDKLDIALDRLLDEIA